MTGPVVDARGLTVGYGGRHRREVLRGVELTLGRGELACLLGPNGSGKSTLLRTLGGMQVPLAGEVRVLGQDVRRLEALERARRIAVVLTDRVEVGSLRVFDLVALGRHPHTGWSGRLSVLDERAVDDALRITGADELVERDVSELSDGERQRVLIARALAQEPALLLLDEPTAFLDAARRVEITALLRRLARETGLAVLCSTHELDLALRSADSVWLTARDGSLRAGAPEDLVLDGSLLRCFGSSGLAFDVEHGSFWVAGPVVGRAQVRGDGPAAYWARRALERVGFTVAAVDEPDLRVDVDVTVVQAGQAVRWLVGTNGGCREHHSLAAVIEDVRGLSRSGTSGKG